MKAADARSVLARVIETIHRHVPSGPSRSRVVRWLHDLEGSLASPASLCTREELFDAIVTDEPPEGEPSLLDDLLEQVSTGALVAYLNARLVDETALSRRIREDLILPAPTETP